MQPSETTETIKWITLAQIIVVYLLQIPLVSIMIGVMQYEWIIALFLSVIYLLFPTVSLLFMFNSGL